MARVAGAISLAWAHGGEVHEGLAGAWTLDPLVLAPRALAALVFWSAVLRPASGRYWGSIAALLVTFKISGIVCVGFLLQTPAVYEAYRNGVDDEHLGWGLMMGIGTLSWLGAAIALTASSLTRLERAHPGNAPR